MSVQIVPILKALVSETFVTFLFSNGICHIVFVRESSKLNETGKQVHRITLKSMKIPRHEQFINISKVFTSLTFNTAPYLQSCLC